MDKCTLDLLSKRRLSWLYSMSQIINCFSSSSVHCSCLYNHENEPLGMGSYWGRGGAVLTSWSGKTGIFKSLQFGAPTQWKKLPPQPALPFSSGLLVLFLVHCQTFHLSSQSPGHWAELGSCSETWDTLVFSFPQ